MGYTERMENAKKETLARTKKLSVHYLQMRDKLITDHSKLGLLTELLDYSYESGIELGNVQQFISDKIDEL
jgi:hypothetical protein